MLFHCLYLELNPLFLYGTIFKAWVSTDLGSNIIILMQN